MTALTGSFDEARLAGWLANNMPGFAGPLHARKFETGQSNPTFRLEAASGTYVLRRKPPGKLLKSAHAVDREYRVLAALRDSAVPVPKVHVLCEDDTVIGSAFYVMDFIAGRIFWDPALPGIDSDARSDVYDEMNRVLAALHGIDVAAAGLADFGRPGNYFARQLARWSDQYRASETQALPDIDALMGWLEAHVPPDDGSAAIVHGDWRIDNMIFAADSARMVAVLDWELSTIGHPVADLAYQCMQWRLPHDGAFRGLAGADRTALGIPTEDDYVARYCSRRGIGAIDDWPFYLAFSFFRLAAILQGVMRRALDGNASNPDRARLLGAAVPVLGRMAVALIETRR